MLVRRDASDSVNQGLESRRRGPLFPLMRQPSSIRDNSAVTALLSTAALVSIATAGALIGLGIRSGDVLRAFRVAGGNVLANAGIAANLAGQLVVGVLHHAVLSGAWGLLFAALALRLRMGIRIVACMLLVPLYVYVIPRIVPASLRIGDAVTNRDTDLFSIAVAISIALLGGAWVAKRD